MLDVHPAHHAASTWRDFFVHIATIALGLLLAIGLEQTVEFFHNRHKVADTREALRREHDLNVKLYAVRTDEYRRFAPILQTDLAIFLYLQKHPGAPQKDLPGKLLWFNLAVVQIDSAWKSAQQNNVLDLMPQDEVQRCADLYRRMDEITTATLAVRTSIYEARNFTVVDPDPSHLSPAEIAHQVELTKRVLLDFVLEGTSQISLQSNYPEFSAPNEEDIAGITHITSQQEESPELHALQERTAQIRASSRDSSAEK